MKETYFEKSLCLGAERISINNSTNLLLQSFCNKTNLFLAPSSLCQSEGSRNIVFILPFQCTVVSQMVQPGYYTAGHQLVIKSYLVEKRYYLSKIGPMTEGLATVNEWLKVH